MLVSGPQHLTAGRLGSSVTCASRRLALIELVIEWLSPLVPVPRPASLRGGLSGGKCLCERLLAELAGEEKASPSRGGVADEKPPVTQGLTGRHGARFPQQHAAFFVGTLNGNNRPEPLIFLWRVGLRHESFTCREAPSSGRFRPRADGET